MASNIRPNDILWTRNGDPARVDKIDERTGDVVLDQDFKTIQNANTNGIKNGLTVSQRDAYKSVLTSAKNSDKKMEIQELYKKIRSLKEGNADQRVIKYLENELQFRIIRDSYVPDDFLVNPVTLDI